MPEEGITHWQYKFMWRDVPCEARDGRIFIDNECVKELTNVNRSSQMGDRFFVEERDVTDICVHYLPRPHISAAPPKEDGEIESLKARIITATGESLASTNRVQTSDIADSDLKTEEKERSKKGIFGLRGRKGRSSVRSSRTA